MTSVQSHRLLLNGSKMMITGLILTLLLACGTSKNIAVGDRTNNKVQIVKADKSGKKDTIPSKTQSTEVTALIIDTIRWSIDSAFSPITIVNPAKKRTPGPEFKSSYNVRLFIPLNSDGISVSQASTSGYVHFYAGALAALEELGSEGIHCTLSVVDTEEGVFNVQKAYDALLADEIDLIIGPFEREDVRYMADKAKENHIAVVSPWQTSTKITTENPWYIQLKPNLRAHFHKIAEHVCASFQKNEVAIIGRNTNDFNAWFSYFESSARQILKRPEINFFEKYYTNHDSLHTGPTAFSRLLQNPKIKAVILPNYSFNDEMYAYTVVRKLAVEKGNRNLILYGMPLLYDSDRIEFDHYSSLNIRIVISDFVDETAPEVREFRKKFLDIFGEIPLADAVKGYDVMMFAGRQIYDAGRNFQSGLTNQRFSYLQHSFEIIKARAEDSNSESEKDTFDYYENRSLNIIEFSNSRFKRIY